VTSELASQYPAEGAEARLRARAGELLYKITAIWPRPATSASSGPDTPLPTDSPFEVDDIVEVAANPEFEGDVEGSAQLHKL
jgi:hypothetical protein